MIGDKIIKTIGRAEPLALPGIGIEKAYARIDTGAQTSAIWVSFAELENNVLAVRFFGENHPAYSGKTYYFKDFTETVVSTSSGHTEIRYKIKLLVHIGGKKIRARFTLANRSAQVYPILIGRNVLRGKFVVDVKIGRPLRVKESAHSQKLQARLKQGDKI